MRRKIVIALLGLGVIAGFGGEIARIRYMHRGGAPLNDFTDTLNAIKMVKSPAEIALTETRHDIFFDDAFRLNIADRALKAVANLDTHRPVILGHQQQDTIVHALAPQLPGFGDSNRILFDSLR